MNFNLDSHTYGAIRFKPVVPASFAKWLIPGSQHYSAKGVFGNILLQQMNAGSASLFYTICDIREDLVLDFHIDGPVWLTHIALKNENRFDIGNANYDNNAAKYANCANAVCLKQGQFNMIRSSSMNGTFYLERGNEYRTFSIYYPGEQLEELLPFFPFLNAFIHGANFNKPALLFKNHHWINAQLIDIINHLLQCPYRGSLRQLYFDYKSKELLLLLLNRENPGTMAQKGLNDHTIEQINEAKYIIEAGFGEPITLHKIARQLGMSEIKLQNGFRQLFGTGIFDYLLQTRMQKN